MTYPSINMDYRNVLELQLEILQQKNSRYSMRAFARDLGIQASQLSRALTRRSTLSLQTIQRIAPLLFTKKYLRKAFIDLYLAETSENRDSHQNLSEIFTTHFFENPSLSSAASVVCLEEWYLFPILDLFTLKNPPRDARTVAHRLNIGTRNASIALKKLQAAGMLKKVDGGYEKTHRHLVAGNGQSNADIRRYHRKLLQRVTWAIDHLSLEKRFLGAQTVAIREDQVPELQAIVGDFFERINDLSASSQNEAGHLYQIALQYFDLTAAPVTAPEEDSNVL